MKETDNLSIESLSYYCGSLCDITLLQEPTYSCSSREKEIIHRLDVGISSKALCRDPAHI